MTGSWIGWGRTLGSAVRRAGDMCCSSAASSSSASSPSSSAAIPRCPPPPPPPRPPPNRLDHDPAPGGAGGQRHARSPPQPRVPRSLAGPGGHPDRREHGHLRPGPHHLLGDEVERGRPPAPPPAPRAAGALFPHRQGGTAAPPPP